MRCSQERELLDHHEQYLGWIHLVGDVFALAAGFGAQEPGKRAGSGSSIASASVLVNFAFIPLAP